MCVRVCMRESAAPIVLSHDRILRKRWGDAAFLSRKYKKSGDKKIPIEVTLRGEKVGARSVPVAHAKPPSNLMGLLSSLF